MWRSSFSSPSALTGRLENEGASEDVGVATDSADDESRGTLLTEHPSDEREPLSAGSLLWREAGISKSAVSVSRGRDEAESRDKWLWVSR